MVYTDKEYMMFTLLASQYDKQQLVSEFQEYVQLIIKSVEEDVNLLSSNETRKEFITKHSITKNKLIEELLDPDINYLGLLAIEELELLEESNISHCSYESPEYPTKLKEISTPPLFLHWKGQFLEASGATQSIAIIGSRVTDPRFARAIAVQAGQLFAENGIWNHSGLALGCDTAGHCGGIASHKHGLSKSSYTGAVLGNGLGVSIYPPENRGLSEEILHCGGYLLSELPPSSMVKRPWLILRDRLQSALSDALFIVQTSINSGTFYTVHNAIKEKKPIFVWKGTGLKIPYEYMEGNYQLINRAPLPSKYRITNKMLQQADIYGIDKPEEILKYLLDNQ